MVATTWLVLGVLAGAFVPSVAYLAWVRRVERYHREPWGALLRALGWGATGGVVLALILELLLGTRPDAVAGTSLEVLWLAVVIAPVVEEATKGLGLCWIDDVHPEPEDGIIYGAAAGLGFAATENLAYATAAYLDGGASALVTSLVLRTVLSTLLHATASGLVGYAIWKRRFGATSRGHVLLFYSGAVVLHATFNLGASLALAFTGLVLLVLSLGGFWWMRKAIAGLDEESQAPLVP